MTNTQNCIKICSNYKNKYSNKKTTNKSRRKNKFNTITVYFEYFSALLYIDILLEIIKNYYLNFIPAQKSACLNFDDTFLSPHMKKKTFGNITELLLSRREKSNSPFAEISKILPLDDTKFIPKIELKLKAKESQIKAYEVMELCPE